VRYLAGIDAKTTAVAAVVVACAIVAAAPARVVPRGLPITTAWSRDYPGVPPVAASVSDGGWLVAGFADHLEIFSVESGVLDGSLPLPASRLACDATTCIAGDDATVRAVDLSRKTVRWQKSARGPLVFAPTLRNGWVFLTTADGHITALREDDGTEIWTIAATARLTGPPSVDGDRIAIATADAAISLLDLRTGRSLWTTALTGGVPGAPRLGGGMVYVGTENRDLQFIRASDGRQLPPQRTGATVVGAPGLDEHLVYTVGQDGVLRAFDRGSRALSWYSDLPTRPADLGPVAEAGLAIVALRNGAFHVFLSDSDGKRPAAAVSAPGAGDSTVLLQVPPMIAITNATARLVTISINVGDASKWHAAVTATAPPLPISGLPPTIPGLALTLTAPR
jgi:hypothetical protein